MNLSEHFTLDELVHSETAARAGLDNTPTVEVIENLNRLCDQILEPLRGAIRHPIFVTSGYRSPAVNLAVRGSKDSDHMLGLAADIVAPPLALDQITAALRSIAPSLPLKQVIIEFGRWVHVSCLPSGAQRQPQFLVASRDASGNTVYEALTA